MKQSIFHLLPNNRKHALLIFGIASLGTFLAFLWFYFSTDTSNPRFGLIYTADEPSYFRPAQNWLETGVWKDNFEGNSSFFQRPPGYGIFYLVHELIFGKYSYLGLLISQFSLFFGSIILFAKLLKELQVNNSYFFWGATSIFALFPMFNGFVGYGLTESITPFLLLATYYFGMKFEELNKFKWLFVAISAFLILVRPQMALIVIGFIIYKIIEKKYRSALIGLISFVPMIIWFTRILIIAPDDFSIHPIYSYTNQNDYRPSHRALTNLARIWEWKSDRFHQMVGSIKNGAINQGLKNVPNQFREEVRPIFLTYHDLQVSLLDSTRTADEKKSLIIDFEDKCQSIEKKLRKENAVTYYAEVPIKSGIEMLSKSQMNLNVFQDKWRGISLVELMRVLSVLLINCSLILVFIFLVKSRIEFTSVLAICILLTLFYYFFIQRLNEERYLVPLLPIIFIIGTFGLFKLVQKK